MSRKFKQHYTNFARHILAEFMTNQELNEIDKRYTEAKLQRFIRKLKGQLK